MVISSWDILGSAVEYVKVIDTQEKVIPNDTKSWLKINQQTNLRPIKNSFVEIPFLYNDFHHHSKDMQWFKQYKYLISYSAKGVTFVVFTLQTFISDVKQKQKQNQGNKQKTQVSNALLCSEQGIFLYVALCAVPLPNMLSSPFCLPKSKCEVFHDYIKDRIITPPMCFLMKLTLHSRLWP